MTKRKKEHWHIGTFTAKLSFLWYDKYSTYLQRHGKATIPKRDKFDYPDLYKMQVFYKNLSGFSTETNIIL